MTQDASSRNTKEEQIDATHKFLRAMAVMFWGVAVFFAIVRVTSSPGSPAKSSAWLTNDAIVWPTIILLIATGIDIWFKKK